MRIIAKPIKARDLKPGDLFSKIPAIQWNRDFNDSIYRRYHIIGEAVYVRTLFPCPDDQADITVSKIIIKRKRKVVSAMKIFCVSILFLLFFVGLAYCKVTPDEPEIININTANQELLVKLPGIGPALALRIVDYRHENGTFQFIEEIMDVSGIGPAKFEKFKDLITTGFDVEAKAKVYAKRITTWVV